MSSRPGPAYVEALYNRWMITRCDRQNNSKCESMRNPGVNTPHQDKPKSPPTPTAITGKFKHGAETRNTRKTTFRAKCQRTTTEENVHKLQIKLSLRMEIYNWPGGRWLSTSIIPQKNRMEGDEKQWQQAKSRPTEQNRSIPQGWINFFLQR